MLSYVKGTYSIKFHALTHKDFRIYWLGQWVSLMGTWMQNIAFTWLVFSLTGSAMLLGLMEAVKFLPITFFSLFAGVIVDKYSKRKILLITQTISMILAFILSALVFTHMARYEFILILALISGVTNTIDMPARQTFTVEMTGKDDLVNAIALSSISSNLARIIGPALGALLLSYLGAGWCFLLNGLSFMAVIASLLRIKAKTYVRDKGKEIRIFAEIKDGLKYIVHEKTLLQIILVTIITGIFVYNYDILIPVFTKDILHQNEKIYGILMSALGIGSLLGAIIVSMKGKSNTKMRVLIASSLVEAVLLICIGLARTYYMAIGFLVMSGIFNIWFGALSNSVLQLTSTDEYRGRVMSVFSLVYAGTAPIGYMLSGASAGRFGADKTFIMSGAVTILLIILICILINARKSRKNFLKINKKQ